MAKSFTALGKIDSSPGHHILSCLAPLGPLFDLPTKPRTPMMSPRLILRRTTRRKWTRQALAVLLLKIALLVVLRLTHHLHPGAVRKEVVEHELCAGGPCRGWEKLKKSESEGDQVRRARLR